MTAIDDVRVRWMNWSATNGCDAVAIHEPRSRDEVIALMKTIAGRGGRAKVIGAGHSFSDIACSEGANLISLRHLATIRALDAERRTVTVEAGASLAALEAALAQHALSLASSCSISEPTVGGMIATGTHGTGLHHRNYANAVRELELVTANGDCLRISADENARLLDAAKISLGALGVITAITFECVPAYRLDAHYQPASFHSVMETLDARIVDEEFFSVWWLPGTTLAQTITARRVDEAAGRTSPRGGTRTGDAVLRASSRLAAASATVAAAGVRSVVASRFRRERRCAGWSEEVFHAKIDLRKRVLEHAIPVEYAVAALREINLWAARSAPPDRLPIEVRFGAADDIWLSPSHGRDVCYIGAMMTTASAPAAAERYFRSLESILAQYDSRPHWGKVTYRTTHDLAGSYPYWSRFKAVREELDPHDTFGNAFLARVFGARSAGQDEWAGREPWV